MANTILVNIIDVMYINWRRERWLWLVYWPLCVDNVWGPPTWVKTSSIILLVDQLCDNDWPNINVIQPADILCPIILLVVTTLLPVIRTYAYYCVTEFIIGRRIDPVDIDDLIDLVSLLMPRHFIYHYILVILLLVCSDWHCDLTVLTFIRNALTGGITGWW